MRPRAGSMQRAQAMRRSGDDASNEENAGASIFQGVVIRTTLSASFVPKDR